jgi:hypothetical protein
MSLVVFGAQTGIHQRAIGLGQSRSARGGHLLKFPAEMLDLVRMVSRDLGAEGALDLLGGRRWLDRQELIKIRHRASEF